MAEEEEEEVLSFGSDDNNVGEEIEDDAQNQVRLSMAERSSSDMICFASNAKRRVHDPGTPQDVPIFVQGIDGYDEASQDHAGSDQDAGQHQQVAQQQRERRDSEELQGLLAEDSLEAPSEPVGLVQQQQGQQELPGRAQHGQQAHTQQGSRAGTRGRGTGQGRSPGRPIRGAGTGPGGHVMVPSPHPQQQQLVGRGGMQMGVQPFMANGPGSYNQAMFLQGMIGQGKIQSHTLAICTVSMHHILTRWSWGMSVTPVPACIFGCWLVCWLTPLVC
jgi:hypothetical protein